jgi:hypothetical protein
MEEPETISLWKRCWLWLVAWVVVIGLMAIPYSGICLRVPWMFPMGSPFMLLTLLLSEWGSAGNFFIAVGWLFYVALTIYALRQNRRARYFVAYTVLCVFLILNVGGCYYEVAKPTM